MSIDLHIESRAFADRIANLGFAAPIPRDWISHELPDDRPNFANPTELVPLAMVTPPHSAIVLAFMARPAFDDGTVHDWAMYLLSAHGMRPRAISIGTLGQMPAIVGEAVQDSEVGPVIVRFAFCEDGGRLINVSLAAPEMLAPTVTSLWFEIVRTFTLDTPLGATTAVRAGLAPGAMPGDGAAPVVADLGREDEDVGEDEDQPEPEAAVSIELEDEDVASAEADTPAEAGEWVMSDPQSALAEFALAGDPATLDPEHPINANLRDRGVGLVPKVVAGDADRSFATIAAPSIAAYLDIPYGWHAIDDGRRTLMFDPANDVQINFNLLERGGRTADEVLDAIEGEARAEYSDPRFVRVASGQVVAIGIGNIQDGGDPLEQYHLLAAGPDPDWLLRARATASPDRSEMAANLAEVILATARFANATYDPEAELLGRRQEDGDGRPDWWLRAVALEHDGRFDEAIATITTAVDHIGAYKSVAQLFAERMIRLQNEGDAERARDAFQRSRWAIGYYASLATSGGEGTALSLERDEFIAKLERAFRGDPNLPASEA